MKSVVSATDAEPLVSEADSQATDEEVQAKEVSDKPEAS